MAYRNGNRKQMMLLPPSIESYVSQNDPVRAYDASRSIRFWQTCNSY